MRIGPYELKETLGQGGMGVVYRAWDPALGRDVAIKILAATANPERFQREARAMAQVTHPNVVKIHASGLDEGGRPWLAMELVEGPSLAERLKALRVLPSPEAVRITARLAAALGELHRVGLLHRDLKPDNVLLRRGEPLLADFGLARDESAERLTLTGQILGTPGYAAPELLQARADPVGPPADVYGLGATLYSMLTGSPPVGGQTLAEVLVATASKAPLSPRELNPSVSVALSELCLRCLAKSPAERPTLDALRVALEGGAPASGRRGGLGLAAVVIAACVAGGAWLMRDSGSPAAETPAPSQTPSPLGPRAAASPSTTPGETPRFAETFEAVERRLRLGDTEGAERIVARAIAEAGPGSALARVLQARTALQTKDHAELEATLALVPSGAAGGFADYLRARSLAERRDHKGALIALDQALEESPQLLFHLERARTEIRLKLWDKAQADLALIEPDPLHWLHPEVEEERALLSLQLGQVQRGLKILRALIARYGPETRYGLLGRLLEAEGKELVEATRALEFALQKQGRNLRLWSARLRIAIRNRDQGDLEQALSRAQAIKRPSPTHRNVCSFAELWLAHLEGTPPQQVRDRLGKLRPRGSTSQLLAGRLWRALDREARARHLFERVAKCELPLHALEAKRLIEAR